MSAWPADLPQFVLAQGYSEELQDNTVRTPMDAPVVKLRRRFTAAVYRVQCQIEMTAAQFVTFEAFYATTLRHGSLPFSWVHPVTRQSRSFKFMQPYRSTIFGVDNRRVQLMLEMRA